MRSLLRRRPDAERVRSGDLERGSANELESHSAEGQVRTLNGEVILRCYVDGHSTFPRATQPLAGAFADFMGRQRLQICDDPTLGIRHFTVRRSKRPPNPDLRPARLGRRSGMDSFRRRVLYAVGSVLLLRARDPCGCGFVGPRYPWLPDTQPKDATTCESARDLAGAPQLLRWGIHFIQHMGNLKSLGERPEA